MIPIDDVLYRYENDRHRVLRSLSQNLQTPSHLVYPSGDCPAHPHFTGGSPMHLVLLATFAGGCFWCMQPPFDHVPGVIKTTVGYMGGTVQNPTYEQICTGKTGHSEVIQIEYDSTKVTYDTLLNIYWKNIDPTNENGQFADVGSQYQPVIFVHSDTQKKAAEASKRALATSQKFKRPIVVKIRDAAPFYPAEGYHQCYYQKSPTQYERYKKGSGRADFIEKTWGTKPGH